MGVSILSMVVLCVIQVASAQKLTDANEAAALKKIIEYWKLGSSLDLTVDPCAQNASWASDASNPRIACDCSSNVCHIAHLKIYALDISGQIPNELFELKELVDLNLAQNVLTGPIPAQFEQLSKMQYLSLGTNNLTGQVPLELGNMTKLLSLSFSSNNLDGPLPAELGKLTSLEQLYIDSSGVSGPIPQDLANLKSLKKLWASDNLFTGKFPEFLGTLTELVDLRFEGTSLEGPIPDSFGALTKLDTLIGDLGGEDSSLDFLRNQTSLSVLSLRSCQLSGQIPDIIGTFSKLIYLDLSFNKLEGPIPDSFQGFTQLQYLFLGSNNLTGAPPANIVSQSLAALDVSFNPLSGNLPANVDKSEFSMNFVGTSINADNLEDRKALEMLRCLEAGTKCVNKVKSTSFSINCGGTEQTSATGVRYNDDSEPLEAASVYTNSNRQWGVSDGGYFISNPNGPQYIAKTDSQITGTLESELYKTARVSPSSLRYFGLGLKNGKYSVELHFAEIKMEDDLQSWKGLSRRIFDVYIQGERVLQDLNIRNEAGGSNRALVKTFDANVTNTVLDIHFRWAGKGTCCIPSQSTYGPLVSAIHASQVAGAAVTSSHQDKKRVGRIVGIAFGCTATLVIVSSVFYLWWMKDASTGHMRVHTGSRKRSK